MKQTAVEFFESELLYNSERNIYYIHISDLKKVKTQAKAMEKEQIEDAYSDGVDDEYEYHINNKPRKNSEQYYNETYGK